MSGGGREFQRGPYADADLGEGRRCLGPLGINVMLPTSSQTRSCRGCATSETNACPVILSECCAALRCFKCPLCPFMNSHLSGLLSVVHSFHMHRDCALFLSWVLDKVEKGKGEIQIGLSSFNTWEVQAQMWRVQRRPV